MAMPESELKDYFEEIFQEKKSNFLTCISNEGIGVEDIAITKCKRSKILNDAYFLLNDNRPKSDFDILPDYKRFKKISSHPISYPRNMLESGTQGRVILSFDITKLGKTENIRVRKELCGDIRSPYTKFKECRGFKKSAIAAAKRMKYEPSQIGGTSVRTNNVLHSITYSFVPRPVSMSKKERFVAAKSEEALAAGNYKKAFEEATQPNLNHRMLDFLAAKAKFYLQDYEEATVFMEKFIQRSKNAKSHFSDSMMAESFSIMIASLFNQNKFEEIIAYEDGYATYIEEDNDFADLFSTTSLYISISFINTGNLEDGVFYLGLASKHSTNAAQQEYIASLFNQISAYL